MCSIIWKDVSMDVGNAKCLDDTELVAFQCYLSPSIRIRLVGGMVIRILSQNNLVQPVHFREPLHHALKTDMGRPDWTVPHYDLATTYWLCSLDDMLALTMYRVGRVREGGAGQEQHVDRPFCGWL